MSKKYKATLVRGETYILGNKTWNRSIPALRSHTVDAATMKHLKASAVDRYTLNGPDGKEVDIKCKFKFEEVPELAETKGGASGKVDKLAELASMQNDGGVDFDDDEAEDEELDADESDDEFADEEQDDAGDADTAGDEDDVVEEHAPAPKAKGRSNPTRTRTGGRRKR